jgi:hypothetical protein
MVDNALEVYSDFIIHVREFLLYVRDMSRCILQTFRQIYLLSIQGNTLPRPAAKAKPKAPSRKRRAPLAILDAPPPIDEVHSNVDSSPDEPSQKDTNSSLGTSRENSCNSKTDDETDLDMRSSEEDLWNFEEEEAEEEEEKEEEVQEEEEEEEEVGLNEEAEEEEGEGEGGEEEVPVSESEEGEPKIKYRRLLPNAGGERMPADNSWRVRGGVIYYYRRRGLKKAKFVAVCNHHKRCAKERQAEEGRRPPIGRPLGFLLAWLRDSRYWHGRRSHRDAYLFEHADRLQERVQRIGTPKGDTFFIRAGSARQRGWLGP